MFGTYCVPKGLFFAIWVRFLNNFGHLGPVFWQSGGPFWLILGTWGPYWPYRGLLGPLCGQLVAIVCVSGLIVGLFREPVGGHFGTIFRTSFSGPFLHGSGVILETCWVQSDP